MRKYLYILIFIAVGSVVMSTALFWRYKNQQSGIAPPTLSLWKTVYPNIRTLTIRTPKVFLPASLKHPGLTQESEAFIPEPIWVIGMRFETVNISTAALHHLNVLNLTSQSPLCASGNLKNLIFAAGQERTSGSFPLGYGYAAGPSRISYSVM